jgi:hypothetical protein
VRRSREAGHLPPVTEISYNATFGELFPTQVFTWEGMEYVVCKDLGLARDIKTGGLRTFKPSTPVRIVTRPKQ